MSKDATPAAPTVSAVERVVERLRDGILRGHYMPGQRLIEADLTREFAVSRGPIREAIRRLTAEGLLDIEYHRGARVKQMSRSEILAVYEVRESLEALAARLAARRARGDAKFRKALLAVQKASATAIRKGLVQDYFELNNRFHDLVVEASGNDLLGELVRRLHVPVFRYQFRTMGDVSVARQSFADHAAIVKAIVHADEAAAERAMRAHIQRSRRHVESLAEGRPR